MLLILSMKSTIVKKEVFKLNKYEKAIMLNTKIMKIFFVVIVIANMFIPLKATSNGIAISFSIFNLIVIGITFYSLLNGLGYFGQNIPFLAVGFVRIIQGLFYYIIRPGTFNWYGFIILVILDVLFILFLFMDRRNYSYIEEEDDEEDEYDEENGDNEKNGFDNNMMND